MNDIDTQFDPGNYVKGFLIVIFTLIMLPVIIVFNKYTWYFLRFLTESSLPVVTAVAAMAGSRELAIAGGIIMIVQGFIYIVTTIIKGMVKVHALTIDGTYTGISGFIKKCYNIMIYFSVGVQQIKKLKGEPNQALLYDLLLKYLRRIRIVLLIRWIILYLLGGLAILLLALFEATNEAGIVAVVTTSVDLLFNGVIVKLVFDRGLKWNKINEYVLDDGAEESSHLLDWYWSIIVKITELFKI